MRPIPTLLRYALGKRLPALDGTIRVAGAPGALTIRRDPYGVAYVDAEDDAGAWFGLGFCQAQDRAFQLDIRLRTLRGTLSQLFGETTVGIDRLARRVGFVDAARKQWAVLDADVRAQIEAFVRGINAGLAATRPAPEFGLLRAQPCEWRTEDVVAMGKLLSFLLMGNWDVELARLKILMLDGAEALRDLDPTPYPEGHVFVRTPPPGPLRRFATRQATVYGEGESKMGTAKAVERLGADIEAFLEFAGASGGSNAWAVAGSRSASGRPILANDPHLEGVMPPHWYLVRLRTPSWGLAGASMIGSPALATGHNGFAAWGVTAGLADTSDLFLEEVAPDGRGVRRGDGFEACEVRREVIEVKGHSPVVEDVLVTPRGPIISPGLAGDLPAISMRAVWLDAKPARGFLRLHEARSQEAFRAEFAHWPLLSQNVVYADTDGHIGWHLVGDVPVRTSGYGTLPAPAADPGTGWEEAPVPYAEMPSCVDPAEGFVATANNAPVLESDGGPFLGLDWLDGYRAGRINEALAERSDWDVASSQRLQLDQVTLAWREVRDVVVGTSPPGPLSLRGEGETVESSLEVSTGVAVLLRARGSRSEISLALSLLRAWDGVASEDSVAATIFERFVREMARRIAVARAPNSAEWALGRGFSDLVGANMFYAGRQSRVLRRLVEQPEGWFAGGWDAEMRDALASVLR